jgi:hypothetical protein
MLLLNVFLNVLLGWGILRLFVNLTESLLQVNEVAHLHLL